MNTNKEIRTISIEEIDLLAKSYCSFHISYNPIVIREAGAKCLNPSSDADIVRKFIKENELKVISCDYGCNCNGVNILKREKFLEYLKQSGVVIKRSQITDDFQCAFKILIDDKECFYIFGSGNNGQEFCTTLSIPYFNLIKQKEFIHNIKKIDDFLYEALEKFNLKIYKK